MILLIVFRSPSVQSNIFGNVVRHYIEETSAAVSTTTDNQLADINTLMQGTDSPEITLDPSTIQGNSIQASEPASTDYLDSFKPDQVVRYTVQPGDSIGSIASDFDVSVNTIIWANDLKNPDAFSPGQVLNIPPVTGVIYTVKSGDTTASIAKKFKADTNKIISFNKLQDGQNPIVGNEIMVPGGELPGSQPSVKLVATGENHGIYTPVGDGQCVAFIQANGYSNYHGNAKEWARYINTDGPTVGGVVVFRGGRFGHLALITAVKENSIQIVEQNYYGLYVVDHREISLNDRSIVGFISK